MDEEEKPTDEEWFEEEDERAFTFKHQFHNWLKDAEMERAKHLDNLLRRVVNHTAQEAPGGQKQAAVVVILADHQRRELWKRKPN